MSETQDRSKPRLIAGNSNLPLAQSVAEYLNTSLVDTEVSRFSDKEIKIIIDEDVRESKTYLIQSTCPPNSSDMIMELILLADACKRSEVSKITAVIPYFGYARQDKKTQSRVPISAKALMNIFTNCGISRIITLDLHSNQIQGFTDIPVNNLFAQTLFLEDIRKIISDDCIIVSPDAGGVERARSYAKFLNLGYAIVDKKRDQPNESKVMGVIGDVRGKKCIKIDDLADTCGTMTNGAEALMKHGAKEVHAYVTHPVLSGPAIDRINDSPIKSFTVTDTIPLSEKAADCKKIKVISIKELIGEAIIRTFRGESVTPLFPK